MCGEIALQMAEWCLIIEALKPLFEVGGPIFEQKDRADNRDQNLKKAMISLCSAQ